MARRKVRVKPSFLIQPDPMIDQKYGHLTQQQIDDEIKKCRNGIEGIKYFINKYIYVQNKIKPEIFQQRPSQFKHLIIEREKIDLKLYKKQEEYLETLFGNRLVASYKSRQCLPVGSIVFTPNGPIEIQELKPNDIVYSFNEETGEIEPDIVVDAQNSGIRECNVITTIDGNRTIQGKNHPFLTSDMKWKISDELKKGDILIQNNGNFGDINIPDHEAKLLGQFITDGRTVKQPSFTNTNYDYIIDVSDCINKYDPDLTITIRHRENIDNGQLDAWDIYPHLQHGSNKKNSFHKFLKRMGIYGHTSKTKILPDCVFSWNKKSVATLLNRCFAGDGWFSKLSARRNGCEIGFGSPCKQFIYQIKQLLWNFGIGSKIKSSYEKGGSGELFYRLVISHRKNIKKFYDEIGIFGKPFDYEYKHNTKADLNRVVSNNSIGERDCQDIETLKNKNFIFDGHVVHNTGISTITQAYVLQYALFNENKEIVIISKSESEAIKFLDIIYYMFNHLPFFLRKQYTKAVKKSFHLGPLGKSTKITVLTSTAKSGRSFSATVLILDEAEFIDHADNLWSSAQPTLSATGGQCVVISTPWLYKSWFYRICHGEEAFKVFKINWSDIPGRDQEWYEQQCAELGHDKMKIQTELDMKWIIPYQTYYMEDHLNDAYAISKEKFLVFQKEWNLGLLVKPEPDREYYFGMDAYEGGKDSNAGVILDDMNRLCCYFITKRLDLYDLVKSLSDHFNTKLCVERNRAFWLIKEFMDKGEDKKYLLYRLVKKKNYWETQWGFLTDPGNRKRLIASTADYLKQVHNSHVLEDRERIFLPTDIMEEMKYFVIKKSKVEGVEHDDLIFALIAALYARDNKNSFTNWKENRKSGLTDKITNFYDMVNNSDASKVIINGKINSIAARNFLSGARGNKSLTVDQLETLDQVLTLGNVLVEEKKRIEKEKREKLIEEQQ